MTSPPVYDPTTGYWRIVDPQARAEADKLRAVYPQYWHGNLYSPPGGRTYDYGDPSPPAPAPNPPPPTPPAPDPSTPGIDPNSLKNATYGKKIPISVLGLARIGGNIIFGPYLDGTRASFGISFGVPADPTGTRQLREIALDSKVAWTLANGFTGESFTYRFYPGTQTQAADPLEIAAFPNAPVAYRPQILLFFENLPLAPFDNKIPYVAAVIGDTTGGADPHDGINLGTALQRLAWSPWTLYDSSTFETVNIADVIGGILLADDYTFLQLCQYIGRIYRNLDILQSDKLRVKDHGALINADITFDPSRIIMSQKPVQFIHQEPSLTSRELELVTIDPDADYVWVPSKAQRPRVPIPTTTSIGKDTVTLPLILGALPRTSMVYFAQYAEEAARKKVSFTATAFGLETQPGDRVMLTDFSDGIADEIFKVTQTVHGANHVVQIDAEAIMRCSITMQPPAADPITCDVAYLLASGGSGSPSHTFSNIGFGDSDAHRIIVVALNMRMSAAGAVITSVTINGNAATQAALASSSTSGSISAIYYVADASIVEVGNVAVVTTGTIQDIQIGSYRLVTTTMAPTNSDSNETTSSGAMPVSVNVPANGFVIAAGSAKIGATFTWTGANQNCIISNQPFLTGQRATASYSGSSETAHVISIHPSSIDRLTLCAAAWTLT